MVDPDKPNKCKLGITKNLNQRIRAYKTAAPKCYFLSTYIIPDKIHEKRILDIIKDVFKVESEYVHCTPSLIKNIIEGYFVDHEIHQPLTN